MASLVLEIQKDALDYSISLSNLLNKALLAAKNLCRQEIAEWIQNEINGYDDVDTQLFPTYRKIRCQVRMQISSGWKPIPYETSELAELEDSISTVFLSTPIAELDGWRKADPTKGEMEIPLPSARKISLQKALRCSVEISQFAPVTVPTQICEKVRNKILNWAIQLEKEGVMGENLLFSPEEKEKAVNVTINNISGGFQNYVNSDSSHQNFNSINIGEHNFENLANFLREKKVEEPDIEILRQAIDEDPKPISSQNFGEKVNMWIGNMMQKAISGVWDIGVATASTLLADAIKKFYEFSS